MEFGKECFCWNTVGGEGVRARDGECTTACSGDARQTCGGVDRVESIRHFDYGQRSRSCVQYYICTDAGQEVNVMMSR